MDSPICLLVDDDDSTLTALIRDLEGRYGTDFDFMATRTGESGLKMLEDLGAAGQPVALIVADLEMPGMTGVELLSHGHRLHPLAMRALLIDYWDFFPGESKEPLHRAMTLGQADSWLAKPWEPPEQLLYPVVDELLGEWRDGTRRVRPAVIHVVGGRRAARSYELRDVLGRNEVRYNFYPADTDEGRRVLRKANRGEDRLPVVVVPDGRVLVQPTNTEVAAALGVQTRPKAGRYDLAVVGAGPAGLSAAVYAACEGLRTLLIEREAFGGQAGYSARIRNYLGFSHGISGRHLAREAREQALLFGVDMVYGEATELRPEGTERVLLMKDGTAVTARAVVIATGITYRRLGVPSVEEFVGAGVFYGSVVTEAPVLHGEDVYVVGGGNAAGQAAVHLSCFVRRVTLVVREGSLAESMSDYLVRELESTDNVSVRPQTRVVDAAGTGHLEQLTLAATGSGAQQAVPAAALFVLIGGAPRDEWLTGTLRRDAEGYVLTGRELRPPGAAGAAFPLAREPFLFESSMPGVFAVGDVRANSVKRIASAVGEGGVAIRMVQEYLSEC